MHGFRCLLCGIPVAVLCVAAFAAEADRADAPNPETTLWYAGPATKWEREALPIGNGRLGAMLFGGVGEARIQFNEDSLWIGDETNTGSYQAFGDVLVKMDHPAPTDYRRELDIARAVHAVAYTSGGTRYRREAFASHPDQVLVFRFTADKPGAHTGTVALTDMHKGTIVVKGNRLQSSGDLAGYTYEGMKRKKKGDTPEQSASYKIVLDYEAQVLVLHEGGTVKAGDGCVAFENIDTLTLLLAADTNFVNQREKGWKGEHPHERLVRQLDAATAKGVDAMRDEHVRDYRQLYDRFALSLGKTEPTAAAKPTNERLAAYKAGSVDTDLEELLFNYARYLMISSSRPGALPANLQGLWNQSNAPPWRSDYHSDVNLQMNYWFVDHANLSPCFEPLTEFLHSIREVRRDETKKDFNTRGWTMHGENGPFGGSTWKWCKPSAAWFGQNLWDHYAFTQDAEYLRARAYPILKELCEFWVDHLKALPDGTLVSPDSFSPEHGPHEDGVSHDQQLVWDLFTNTIEAAATLGVDEDFRKQIAGLREKLLGPKIGKWGQLQEWMIDRDDPKDQHRHLSHLIAVHPGRQISPLTTPKLVEAAKVSMNARGDGATGWSRAWKICIWSRLHDGDRTYKILSSMIKDQIADNLYDLHPPFQIDGNFGYAAGICDMLVQSHMGDIHLLPALPKAWPTGEVKGIRARGGFELDVRWADGKLVEALVRSTAGKPCRIRSATPVTVTCEGKAVEATAKDGVVSFPTQPGGEYRLLSGDAAAP